MMKMPHDQKPLGCLDFQDERSVTQRFVKSGADQAGEQQSGTLAVTFDLMNRIFYVDQPDCGFMRGRRSEGLSLTANSRSLNEAPCGYYWWKMTLTWDPPCRQN